MLNAFRHQRGGHPTRNSSPTPALRVLNAFRHQRGGHADLWDQYKKIHGCSTPFGIREVGTRPGIVRTSVKSRGAQRLSASERWALKIYVRMNLLKFSAQRLSASERWARSVPVTLAGLVRECSTPFGIREVGTWEQDSYEGGDRYRCSTPFGIREVGTVSATSFPCTHPHVLNAFRHQRGGHVGPAHGGGNEYPPVLNAFRHQRGGHTCRE